MRQDQPSRTAYKVAIALVALGAKPGMDKVLPHGLAEATQRLLVASGAAESATVRWARSQWAVSVYESFDWMLPGQFEAFGHRKAFCEHQVKDGIGDGATQVLVLGAGYDTMAWRLAPEFPEVNFFEIDHPATARLKAKGVDAMGPRDNLHLIAEDLGKRSLTDVLGTNSVWGKGARTAIIAEGLLMYLHPEAVRDLFCQSARIVGAGSRIVFTYIPSGSDDRPDVGRWTWLISWLQMVAGEPWTWSIRPDDLDRFLRETGWTIDPEKVGKNCKHGVEYFAVATK